MAGTDPRRMSDHGSQVEEHRSTAATSGLRRYERDSLEFARIVTLADGVFAIALTLLVLTLNSLTAGPLITFGLAFFLVASVWWQHHRIFAQLAWVDPGLIALNLTMISFVALAPFPTSLIVADPRSRPAVLAFLTVFALLTALCLAIILRAQKLRAWHRPLPHDRLRWVTLDWTANLMVYLGCMMIAVWTPLVALICVAFGSTLVNSALARLGPLDRSNWL